MTKSAGALKVLRGAHAAGYRSERTDFYCIRFRIWYSSYDCAIRTKLHTYSGCLKCDQGRFNLKRHGSTLHKVRFPVLCD